VCHRRLSPSNRVLPWGGWVLGLAAREDEREEKEEAEGGKNGRGYSIIVKTH